MYQRHLHKLASMRLDDVLLDEALLDRAVVEDAQAEAEMTGRPLSQLLFERDALDEWALAKIVAIHYSLPCVDPTAYAVPRDAEQALPLEFCVQHRLVPFDLFGDSLAIAVCEMPSTELLDTIQALSGRTPFIYVALHGRIQQYLDQRSAQAGGASSSPAAPPPAKKAPAPAAAGASPASAGGVALPPPVEPGSTTPVAAEADDEPAAPPPAPVRELQPLPALPMRLGFSMHVGAGKAVAGGKRAAAASRPVALPPSPAIPAPVAAAPAAAAKPAGDAKSWESVFDIGDSRTGR